MGVSQSKPAFSLYLRYGFLSELEQPEGIGLIEFIKNPVCISVPDTCWCSLHSQSHAELMEFCWPVLQVLSDNTADTAVVKTTDNQIVNEVGFQSCDWSTANYPESLLSKTDSF